MSNPILESVSPWVEPEAVVIVAGLKNEAACEHCQKPFQPHRGKRFCSSQCRVAFHNAKRVSETPPETPSRFNETPKRVSETVETVETPKPSPQTAAPKPEPEFDWNDREAPIVLAEQPETAVYRSPTGHLVIRQKDWPNDDIVVLISPQYIMEFVDRLTDVAGVPSFGRGA
jgi:hypothetical protein